MDRPVGIIIAPRCRGQASLGGRHSGGICRGTPTTPGRHGCWLIDCCIWGDMCPWAHKNVNKCETNFSIHHSSKCSNLKKNLWGLTTLIRMSPSIVQSWDLVCPKTISNVFESLKSTQSMSYVSTKKKSVSRIETRTYWWLCIYLPDVATRHTFGRTFVGIHRNWTFYCV